MTLLKRNISIFTGSRAEYGLLKRLMQDIDSSKDLELQIITSGMHLSPEFGLTICEIQGDGFNPDEKVEILLSSDTPTGICKSMGLALIGYGEALQRLKPDMLILLGDRFETFCMAAAAQVCRIPVAHIHGGEVTEGNFDEAFRHSITKMSQLHFTSCEEYRRRIIQLGESPERVFNVGSLGIENIRKVQLLDCEYLSKIIDFDFSLPFFLVTFHPVTLEIETSREQFQALISALSSFPNYKVVFTKANSDTDGRIINLMIDEYCQSRKGQCLSSASLGAQRYLSIMKQSEVVIGNSSSGIIETPSFKIPTVNIGDRQKGRLRPLSVVDCNPDKDSIISAIKQALSFEFKLSLRDMKNPYEKSDTSRKILDVIAKYPLLDLMKKNFYNLPQNG